MSYYAHQQFGNAQSDLKTNARKAIEIAQKWGDTSENALWAATKELIYQEVITDNQYASTAREAVKLFAAGSYFTK
jgi:hypothetical protein